jgi:hypothetical protein
VVLLTVPLDGPRTEVARAAVTSSLLLVGTPGTVIGRPGPPSGVAHAGGLVVSSPLRAGAGAWRRQCAAVSSDTATPDDGSPQVDVHAEDDGVHVTVEGGGVTVIPWPQAVPTARRIIQLARDRGDLS